MKPTGILIAVIFLLIPFLMPSHLAAQASTVIWSANFGTGDHSQFNECWVETPGATVNIATNIVHSGRYSEYDYYNGQGGTGSAHRAYCGEGFSLSGQYSNIENDIWIYVPSTVNGTAQDYQGWFTFVNLFFQNPTGSINGPLLVMGGNYATGCNQRQLSLGGGPFTTNNVMVTSNVVDWPVNEWFELRTIVTQTSSISVITLYEVSARGAQQLVTNMTSASTGLYLYQAHWGLYDGPPSGVSAIYNDDITVSSLGTTQSAVPAAVTSMSTSTVKSTTTSATKTNASLTSTSSTTVSKSSTISSTARTVTVTSTAYTT